MRWGGTRSLHSNNKTSRCHRDWRDLCATPSFRSPRLAEEHGRDQLVRGVGGGVGQYGVRQPQRQKSELKSTPAALVFTTMPAEYSSAADRRQAWGG